MDWINANDRLPDTNDEVLIFSEYMEAPVIEIGRYFRKGDKYYEEAHMRKAWASAEEQLGRKLNEFERVYISIFDERKFKEDDFYFYRLNQDELYEFVTYPKQKVLYWAKLDLPEDYTPSDE